MKISIDDHCHVLNSARKPHNDNRKNLHRQRTKGIGSSKLKDISDPGKGVSVWGVTLASQFYSDPSWRGEQALMAAILNDAITVHKLGLSVNQGSVTRDEVREAETWLRDEDCSSLFSFANICAVLGLDPDYIRAGIFAWRKAA